METTEQHIKTFKWNVEGGNKKYGLFEAVINNDELISLKFCKSGTNYSTDALNVNDDKDFTFLKTVYNCLGELLESVGELRVAEVLITEEHTTPDIEPVVGEKVKVQETIVNADALHRATVSKVPEQLAGKVGQFIEAPSE